MGYSKFKLYTVYRCGCDVVNVKTNEYTTLPKVWSNSFAFSTNKRTKVLTLYYAKCYDEDCKDMNHWVEERYFYAWRKYPKSIEKLNKLQKSRKQGI